MSSSKGTFPVGVVWLTAAVERDAHRPKAYISEREYTRKGEKCSLVPSCSKLWVNRYMETERNPTKLESQWLHPWLVVLTLQPGTGMIDIVNLRTSTN